MSAPTRVYGILVTTPGGGLSKCTLHLVEVAPDGAVWLRDSKEALDAVPLSGLAADSLRAAVAATTEPASEADAA